jgi:hypothetical protein
LNLKIDISIKLDTRANVIMIPIMQKENFFLLLTSDYCKNEIELTPNNIPAEKNTHLCESELDEDMLYTKDILKEPEETSRNAFIDEILYLGITYGHNCDTILSAIQIGDIFCRNKANMVVWKSSSIKLDRPAPKYYSIMLAHVCTLLACKQNEDFCYSDTSQVCRELDTKFVVKLEWEIFISLNYKLPRPTIVTNIASILGYSQAKEQLYLELTPDLAMLNLNGISILSLSCAIMWLYKKRKLKAHTRLRERKFIKMIKIINTDYGIVIPDIIKALPPK